MVIFTWLFIIGAIFIPALNTTLKIPNFNLLESLITTLLLIPPILIPFGPFFLDMLPFQPIDFSPKALRQSILHTLFFICSSPILVTGFIVNDYITIIDPSLQDPCIKFIIAYLLICCITIVWILVTLLIWEMIFGKNSSRTLQILREGKFDYFLREKDTINMLVKEYSITNESHSKYESNEWLTFILAISMLIGINFALMSDIFGIFFLLFGFGLSLDFFMLFFCLPLYETFAIKKGLSLDWTKEIMQKFFRTGTISDQTSELECIVFLGVYGTLLVVYGGTRGYLLIHLVCFLMLLFIPVLFLYDIWSNQIKEYFYYHTITGKIKIRKNYFIVYLNYCPNCGNTYSMKFEYCKICGYQPLKKQIK